MLVDGSPPPHGPQVVPQRQMPGRLDPTEDPRHLSLSSWSSRPPRPAGCPSEFWRENKNGRRGGGR
ncbi:deoR family transcriptional regulator of rhamnose utilization [Streptomyces sp. NL15-2K]|nr:deoR family transcriptional regulator of rhamnose utilization [Streptomyces sp. NL15-2K]